MTWCMVQACGLYPMIGRIAEKSGGGGGASVCIITRDGARVVPAASSVNYDEVLPPGAGKDRKDGDASKPDVAFLAFDEVTRGAFLSVSQKVSFLRPIKPCFSRGKSCLSPMGSHISHAVVPECPTKSQKLMSWSLKVMFPSV
jgi:hypothetical protein